jgi:hypothetical protein
MVDEQIKICQNCKNRKNKKCVITGEYVARKKPCQVLNEFSLKEK